MFDKPILQLGNWFGEVQKKTPTDYLIKNPSFNLKAHTTKSIRFFVRYHVNEPPPLLQGFRINAKTVCPEDLMTTTPITTTEQLFTNSDEENENYLSTEATLPRPSTTSANIAIPMSNAEIYDVRGNSFSQITQPDDLNSICGVTADHQRGERKDMQVAYKGEFPWHASIYYTGITINYLCTASLISKHHILTAAHCTILSESQKIIDPERLIVYLGKYYVKHLAHHEGTQTHLITDIIIHPSFDAETYSHDIAVMKTLDLVEFTDTVRPICLWTQTTGFNTVGKPGIVVGWGFDHNGRIQEELTYALMNIHRTEVCYRSPIRNFLNRITSSAYCANFVEGTKKCVGDSGGGMVVPGVNSNNKSVWQLKGIVSISVVLQGKLECDRNHYAVFTDVGKYLDWIKETTTLHI